MGYILEATCSCCNKIYKFNLGQGMQDWKKDVVAAKFSDKEIINIIENEFGNWTFSWKLGHCEWCNSLQRVPVLDKFNNDNKVSYMDADCSCGNRIAKIVYEKDKESKLYCEECGQALKVQEVGLWD